MPRERTLLLLLLTFAVGGFILGQTRYHGGSLVRYQLSPEIPPAEDRSAIERRWRQLQFEPEASFGSATAEPLLRSTAAKAGPGGETLVLDWGDAAVKAFDQAGRLARRYPPTTTAPAAGAGLRPADFAVAGSGEVWIADRDAPRVVVFDAGGTRLRTFTLDSTANRLVLAADGGFTILTFEARSHLFESYGPDGEFRRRFGRLLDGDDQQPLLLGGTIAADGDGGLVFAPSFLGLLAAYDGDGRLRFLVDTVAGEGRDLPRVLTRDNYSVLEPGTPLRSLSVQVAGATIYVLSERESAASRTRIVDVYALADGAYRHSFRLPNGPRNVLIAEDSLLTVHKDRIQRWRARAGIPG